MGSEMAFKTHFSIPVKKAMTLNATRQDRLLSEKRKKELGPLLRRVCKSSVGVQTF